MGRGGAVDGGERLRPASQPRGTRQDDALATSAAVVAEGPDIFGFRNTWERLYNSRRNEPSTSFEWTAALMRHHLEDGDRLLLLALSRASEVIALVPLVARPVTVFGVSVGKLFPIAEGHNTHSDLLAEVLDPEAIRAFVSALLRLDVRWDVFRLANVLEDHPLVKYCEAGTIEPSGTLHARDGYPSYYLVLPSSYAAYVAGRSAKFRNHLKRAEKKVEEQAARVIEVRDASEVDQAYGMLLEIERASWKHQHGTAISAIPRQTAFYRDLCRGASVTGRLHLQILTLAGRPVAYNLRYVDRGSYSYLKTSYAEGVKPLGAATYLRARLVATLIGQGVRHMDFPAEPYEWERQWTDTVRWHKVLSLYRATPGGRALALADRVRGRFSRGRAVRHIDPRALKPVEQGR
jgi:CelD/BcsL family acetyltransferase involved in cellulose biosynthesis